MSYYMHMQWIGDDYFDVDIKYDIIDGDASVGLKTDYEFTATVINEHGLPEDITDNLTSAEHLEVIEAIEKDQQDWEYNNATD
jgi:hypothetical protein